MSIEFGGSARRTVGMHLSADEIRVAVVSRDGGSTLVDAMSPAVHQVDGEMPTAVEGRGARRSGWRTDVVARLGERALVPLHDSWFPPTISFGSCWSRHVSGRRRCAGARWTRWPWRFPHTGTSGAGPW